MPAGTPKFIVKIEEVERPGYDYPRYSTRVSIDGVCIGEGTYGGEPEDNSLHRDYSWVPRLLSDMAEFLGAKVLTSKVKEDYDSVDDEFEGEDN